MPRRPVSRRTVSSPPPRSNSPSAATPAPASIASHDGPASTRRCSTTTSPANSELYRTLLRQTFGALAAELRQIAAADAAPDQRLRAAVTTIATFVESHSFFPAIMLREMAEGGAHLDGNTLAALASLPRAFVAILQPGIDAGHFRPMHPVASYFTTLAPIVMFVASAPLRKQLESRQLLPSREPLTPQMFLAHLTTSLERAFATTTLLPRQSHA